MSSPRRRSRRCRPRLALSSTEAGSGRGRWVVVGIVVALVAVFSIAFVLAEQAGLEDAETWRSWLDAPGGQLGVGAVVVGALVVDLVLPVPSSIVMTLSGGLLGLVPGALANIVGSMGASWLGFGLARLLGRGAFVRWVGADHEAVERWFSRYGPWALVLSRAVPMLTEVVSCLAGLHRMSWIRFTWLSLAGTVPVSIVYAWAGASGA